MAKGKIGERYFNVITGAVVKPVYDYDELGDDYNPVTDKLYPVFDMRRHYVGYINNNKFIVPWSNENPNREQFPDSVVSKRNG